MMRNRKTNEKFHCTEWELWFFYWVICLTQGFKEVRGWRHKTPVCVSQLVRKWWQPFPTGKGAKNQLKCDVIKGTVALSWNWESRWSTWWCWPLLEGRFPRGKAVLISAGTAASWGVSRLCFCWEEDCWQSVWERRSCCSLFLEQSDVQQCECGAGAAARPWAHLVLLPGQPSPVPMVLHSLLGSFWASLSILIFLLPVGLSEVPTENKIRTVCFFSCFYSFRIFPTCSFSCLGCFYLVQLIV